MNNMTSKVYNEAGKVKSGLAIADNKITFLEATIESYMRKLPVNELERLRKMINGIIKSKLEKQNKK